MPGLLFVAFSFNALKLLPLCLMVANTKGKPHGPCVNLKKVNISIYGTYIKMLLSIGLFIQVISFGLRALLK